MLKKKTNRLFCRLLPALLVFMTAVCFHAVPAAAQKDGPYVQARLVAENTAIVPGEPFWVGVVQTITPEWHTYWVNPGDSGEPSLIEWELDKGLQASEIHWPYPEYIPYGPLSNYGYSDEVMLMVEITPPADLPDDEMVILKGTAAWLACKEICIPEEEEVVLALPVRQNAQPDPEYAELFARYRKKLPQDAGWDARFRVSGDQLHLTVGVPGGLNGDKLDARFFGYEWGAEIPSATQTVTRTADGFGISTEWGGAARPDGESLSGVVVFGTPPLPGTDKQAFIVRARMDQTLAGGAASPAGSSPGGGDPASRLTLWAALGLALLGGMVLNLMPCVFPVLSVKAIGLVAHSAGEAGVIRRHGWLYTLGVLLSFAVLAGALLGLRAGGEGIGWGFQLQSPLFITLLAYLFFAVGLNLSGFFSFGERLAGVGSEWAAAPGDRGAFFTGVLAAIVATPCTAPFMAAALGYALTQPPAAAMGVFLALGMGLALPYLLLCYSPALLKRMPKPGAWMETLRQFLAFPMYLSVAWLIWVMARQTDGNGVIYALTGLVLIAMAVWFHRIKKDASGDGRSGLAWVAVIVALLVATHADRGGDITAVPFSESELAGLRADNRPVFVNMTADWCITCKVNEQVALTSGRVQNVFAEKGVVYMKGDWTQRNRTITKFLDKFGRSGVPLYLYYPPGQPRPLILPQILTPAIVIDHIEGNVEEGKDT